MAQAIRRSTENSGTIHPPPGHANYNMSAKAYYNIHGYVTIHIGIPLRQVYCNPPLRIPQYVFKYNYNYRCLYAPCSWSMCAYGGLVPIYKCWLISRLTDLYPFPLP